jgi:hypothetical protein
MIDNSNSTSDRKNSAPKVKKENKNSADSKKNTKKSSAIATPVIDDTKVNKDDKYLSDYTKENTSNIASAELEKIIDTKNENKEKEHLSYFEKQVLKELKGIRKASKNILKTIKKINV